MFKDSLRKIKNMLSLNNEIEPKNQFKAISYSQEGEDLILEKLFEAKKKGFYLDIGAHHPYRFPTPINFYEKGWNGINIDAAPGFFELFSTERPNDINIETGVSLEEKILTYYIFNEPALNTFNKEEAQQKNGVNNYFVIEEKKLQTKSLNNILKEFLPRHAVIDFLTVDVEGFDLQVLMSNDWEKFKPTVILVEELRSSIEMIIKKSEVYKFLINKNYQLYARTYNTSFYKVNH